MRETRAKEILRNVSRVNLGQKSMIVIGADWRSLAQSYK